MTTCYIIRRSIAGTYFTINSTQKPAVLAFTNKNNARFMLKHVVEFGKKQQKLVLEQVKSDWLIQQCSLNSLDVTIYENDQVYSSIDTPNEDYVFKLEDN
jgi:hypothetical protein